MLRRHFLATVPATVLVTVSLCAAGLVVDAPSANAAPALASTESVVSPPAVTDVPIAADEAAAAAVAVKFDHPVAVDAETTPTTQVSVLPDGTMSLQSDAVPVRAQKDGRWQAIDSSLTAATDGPLAPVVSAAPVVFSGGGSGPLAKVQTASGAWLSESWPYGDLPAPTVDGATATYASVFPGVDLRLTATASGMSEVLVISSPAAAANPALADLQLTLSGGAVSLDAGRSMVAKATDGSTLSSSAPLWWDSSNAEAGPDGPGGDGGLRPVDHSASGTQVSLDLSSLAATPDVHYPLYVDPDWTGNGSPFWFTDRAYPNQSYLNGQYSAGYQSVGNGAGYLSHAFWQFSTAALAHKHVISATFNTIESYSNTCTNKNIQLWRYGLATPGFTWNTEPTNLWMVLLDTKALSYGSSCSGAHSVGFVATLGAVWAAQAASSKLQLGLKAQDDSDTATRRHFNQAASLTVHYNTPPNTPAAPAFTAPPRVCGTAASPVYINGGQPVVLRTTVTDADAGTNVNAKYYIVNGSTLATVTTFGAPQQAQGVLSVTVPANTLPPGYYAWRAQAGDNIDLSPGFSAYCYFYVKNTPPAAPTVTASVPAGSQVGGILSVTLGSSSTDKAAAFGYWWTDGDVAGGSATPPVTLATPSSALPVCGAVLGAERVACPGSTGSVTISVAPIDTSSTLRVISYDLAGNASTVTSHNITVDPSSAVSFLSGHGWSTDSLPGPVAAGQTVSDSNMSSSAQPLTIGTGLSTVAPPAGSFVPYSAQVYSLPGVADANITGVNKTTGPAVNTSGSFTVSAWLYPNAAATGRTYTALSQAGTASAGFALQVATTVAGSSPVWRFCLNTTPQNATPTWTCVASTTAATAGVWTFVTGVWDANNHQLRLLLNSNAAAVAVAPVSGTVTTASGAFTVGSSSSGSVPVQQWTGLIADPTIFPGVIGHAQLNNLYEQVAP